MVNFPADPFARIKNHQALDAMADSLATRFFFMGLPLRRQAEIICDAELVENAINAAHILNFPVKKMISRAYHDSLFMAQVCPTTMIFIPCYKGYSHRPDEFSSPEQIEKGVRVLADTLAAAANRRGVFKVR